MEHTEKFYYLEYCKPSETGHKLQSPHFKTLEEAKEYVETKGRWVERSFNMICKVITIKILYRIQPQNK